jgi:hypothetical protein
MMSLTDATQIDNTGRAVDASFAANRPAVIVLIAIAVALFELLAGLAIPETWALPRGGEVHRLDRRRAAPTGWVIDLPQSRRHRTSLSNP